MGRGRNLSSNTASDSGPPQMQQGNFQSPYHPDSPSAQQTALIQQQYGVHQQGYNSHSPYQPNSPSAQQTTLSQQQYGVHQQGYNSQSPYQPNSPSAQQTTLSQQQYGVQQQGYNSQSPYQPDSQSMQQYGLSQQQYNLPSQQAYNPQSPFQTNGQAGQQFTAQAPGQTAYSVESQYSYNSGSSAASSPTPSTGPLIVPAAAGRVRQRPTQSIDPFANGSYPSAAQGSSYPHDTEPPLYPAPVVALEPQRRRSDGANLYNGWELHHVPSDGIMRGGSDIGNVGPGETGAGEVAERTYPISTSPAPSAPAYTFVGSSPPTTRSPSLVRPVTRGEKLTKRPR
ncbi:hypothetical protein JAAARDRAFT_538306 [Jaapia argillacea MUCL 33604]|uniref:Uncharacterized protein n=1 Tax=Jaapia argillacea MUCL 33604 TaxID=933084 RepID=A0A067PBB8_9AGAM|nr:hypothetical protein JAAARDRAFT_538306 [Jaapia argillacea MUCL 33604]